MIGGGGGGGGRGGTKGGGIGVVEATTMIATHVVVVAGVGKDMKRGLEEERRHGVVMSVSASVGL